MAADKPPAGVHLIIDNAAEVPFNPAIADEPPEPPKKRGPEIPPDLPEDCPVKPLGKLGTTCFYLDANRQLVGMSPREHGHAGIASLFGRFDHCLEETWPRKAKRTVDGEEVWITTGWKPELAMRALMRACAERGIWNPFERIRGRGAWPAPGGTLIYHAGDQVYDGRHWREPGVMTNHVYPGGEAIPKPWDRAVKKDVGADFLSLLNSWHWRRPKIDPRLLLGWCGAALVGGALDWRPNAWITGERNTGKSSLQGMLRHLFGRGVIQVADASEAAIRRKLDHDALPVAFDELESKDDNRRAQAIIGFARLAASGSVVLRVGDDKSTEDFTARACFLFSSILVPSLLGQDRSRLAMLELLPLKETKAPDIGEERMGKFGRQFLRRLLDNWGRFGQSLTMYREALMREGHSARGADVFGTLLAIADVMLHDGETDSDTAEAWAFELQPSTLTELSDDASDQERCLQHLLTTAIPRGAGFNGHAVAHYIERAASDDENDVPAEANRLLNTHGLKVFRDDKKRQWLAIANYNVELAKIFADTQWSGQPGALAAWVQSLRRLPLAEKSIGNIRIGSVAGKAVLIPIELVVTGERDKKPRARDLLEH